MAGNEQLIRLGVNERFTPWIRRYGPLCTLVAISSLVLFWKLGQNTLQDWDEAEYGQISKEMIASGDWMTPFFNYEPKFHQPPLFVWVMVFFINLLGESEFADRLPSVLSGIGLVLITYQIGKLLYTRSVGLLGGGILSLSYGFVDGARFATTDMMLCLFIYLAFYGFLRAERDQGRWWYLVWVAFALAFLTKSAGGLLIPIVIGSVLIGSGRLWPTLHSPVFWRGGLVWLVVASIWPLLMYWKHGQAFIDEFFLYHILTRTTQPLEGNTGTSAYYFNHLSYRFYPWLYLVPMALGVSLWENLQGQRRSILLLLTSMLVLGLFTAVRTKLFWYIIPVYPALSLLVAAVLMQAMQPSRWLPWLLSATTVYLLTVNFTVDQLPRTLFFCGLALVVYVLVGLVKKTRRPPLAILVMVLLMEVALNNLRPLYGNQVNEIVELAKLAARKPDAAEGDSLLIYHNTDYQGPVYYSNRLVRNPMTLTALLLQTQDRQVKRIILPKEEVSQVAAEHKVKVVATTNRFIYAFIKRKGISLTHPSNAVK